MRPTARLAELENGSQRLILISKGTAVFNSRTGKTSNTRKTALVVSFTAADGKLMWDAPDGHWRETEADDLTVYDPEHAHGLNTSSHILGGSAIRGGGVHRATRASCTCGWRASGNNNAKEAREAFAEHLSDVAQVCAWLERDTVELTVSNGPDPLKASTWPEALNALALLPEHHRRFSLVRCGEPDILGRSNTLVSTSGLPDYLLEAFKFGRAPLRALAQNGDARTRFAPNQEHELRRALYR